MIRKILHGLDGSPNSFKALEEAICMALKYEAQLHTITVEEVPRYPGAIGEVIEEKATANGKYREVIGQAKEMAGSKGLMIKSHLVVGHEVKTILEFVKKYQYDVLIIGFMGHSAIYNRVMGSTGQTLVRLAPCSVFVIK
jgi:nucleotide-binding universal stress UspA family protein